MADKKVYIFWDNSNIYHSAQLVAQDINHAAGYNVRVQFDNLYKLALAGRKLGKAYAIGSVPPEQRDVWNQFQLKTGIQIELYERGADTGTEQGIDQCLQVYMLRACEDEQEPQIAVLLSGDGAGYNIGTGFWADLERVFKKGWGIELLSWDISCKRKLKKWIIQNGVYIKLEDYYNSITYIEGGRNSTPINLTHRQKASPRLVDDKITLELKEMRAAYEEEKKKNENNTKRIKKLKYQLKSERRAIRK